jgi:quinol monooxygenase YgiN
MKRILLVTLLACSWWASKAQNIVKRETIQADSTAISQLLEKFYFKGIYEGDLQLLKQVYYNGTLLFGDVKGKPYAKTLDEYLTGVANRQSPKKSGKPFKGEVLNVRVINSIAVAEVKVEMYDFVYLEYLSFHKIDGQWLLVNKMISDVAQNASSSAKIKGASGGKKFNLIATIEILPGFEAAIKKAMVTMAAETRKETGVELFLISTEKDSPQTILIYETYRSETDFELHKTLAHSKVFFEFVKGKIKDDKIGVTFLTGIDN